MNLEPPSPCPPDLWPQHFELGEKYLRVSLSTEELRMLTRMLDHERLSGHLILTQRDGSPWIEISVAIVGRRVRAPDHVSGGPAPGSHARYALWRYTASIYRIGSDGAVQERIPLEPARTRDEAST